jgi:RNA polymerase sigma-70 factor, ECF subfamily
MKKRKRGKCSVCDNDQSFQLLLERSSTGDREAFEAVYRKIKDKVYRTVYFLLKDKHDVQDVVSEVYIELFKSLKKFDNSYPFQSWLNGLIVRQVSNHNRKAWRRFRLFERQMLNREDLQPEIVDDRILQKEKKSELLAFVDLLSFKLKSVIVLRYYHEHTYEEISLVLNIPVGTVKSRHNQAIKKLREHIGYTINVKEESQDVSRTEVENGI